MNWANWNAIKNLIYEEIERKNEKFFVNITVDPLYKSRMSDKLLISPMVAMAHSKAKGKLSKKTRIHTFVWYKWKTLNDILFAVVPMDEIIA